MRHASQWLAANEKSAGRLSMFVLEVVEHTWVGLYIFLFADVLADEDTTMSGSIDPDSRQIGGWSPFQLSVGHW